MKTSENATITVRDTPAGPPSAAGSLAVVAEPLVVDTVQRIQLVDLTDTITDRVWRSGVREGLASLWSMHTTCAIFINEAQQALQADILRVLEEIVDRDAAWMHNDPRHSDCERMNADSHLRAMFLGHGVTLQVSGGKPVLGRWQRVLLAELDGARTRTVRLQVTGVKG